MARFNLALHILNGLGGDLFYEHLCAFVHQLRLHCDRSEASPASSASGSSLTKANGKAKTKAKAKAKLSASTKSRTDVSKGGKTDPTPASDTASAAPARPKFEIGSVGVRAAAWVLFAVHPLRVEAVSWCSAQPYLVAAFFSLVCVCFHVRARLEQLRHYREAAVSHGAGQAVDVGGGGGGFWWRAFSVVSFGCAVASKASSVTLCVIPLLVDATVLRICGPGCIGDGLASRKGKRPGAVGACAAAVYHNLLLVVIAMWISHAAFSSAASIKMDVRTLTLVESLLRAGAAPIFYLAKSVHPNKLAWRYYVPPEGQLGVLSFQYGLGSFATVAFTEASVVNVWNFLRRRRMGPIRRQLKGSVRGGTLAQLARNFVERGFGKMYTIDHSVRGGGSGGGGFKVVVSYAWLAYLGILLPTLGLLSKHVTGMAADRYTYLPALFVGMPLTAEPLRRVQATGTTSGQRAGSGRNAARARLLVLVPLLLAAAATKTSHFSRVWSSELELWTHSVNVNELDAHAWCNRGVLSGLEGQYERAMDEYARALALNPDDAECRYNRATTLTDQAQGEPAREEDMRAESIREYTELVADHPEHFEARYNLANVLLEEGDLEGAVEAYDGAIEIDPTSASAHYNKGNALKKLGRRKEALKAFKEAGRLDPSHSKCWMNAGNIYLDAEKYEKAIDSFQRCIKANPVHARAHLALGHCLRVVGRHKEGEQHQATAVELEPALANFIV